MTMPEYMNESGMAKAAELYNARLARLRREGLLKSGDVEYLEVPSANGKRSYAVYKSTDENVNRIKEIAAANYRSRTRTVTGKGRPEGKRRHANFFLEEKMIEALKAKATELQVPYNGLVESILYWSTQHFDNVLTQIGYYDDDSVPEEPPKPKPKSKPKKK